MRVNDGTGSGSGSEPTVYIAIDMEGVAGVSHPGPTEPGAVGYAEAVELMVGEANAAVDGAYAGGARYVLVNDSHARMDNLRPAALDPRARLLQGQKFWSMVAGAEPEAAQRGPRFDVALLIGFHARAGHPNGTQAHTYTGRVMEVRLDGRPAGEVDLGAAVLAEWGVPVGMVSGDDALTGDVTKDMPWVEAVTLKEAHGTNAATSVHPSVACELIRGASLTAVQLAVTGDLPDPEPHRPILLEIDFRRAIEADLAHLVPGTTRVGSRTLRYEAPDAPTMFRAFQACVYLAGTADE